MITPTELAVYAGVMMMAAAAAVFGWLNPPDYQLHQQRRAAVKRALRRLLGEK